MRCTQATYQIQLYIDHQLTLRQIRLLENHLSFCSDCRTELVSLEKIVTELTTFSLVQEPDSLHTQIMQRVALVTAQQQLQIEQTRQDKAFSPFRPSLSEILAAVVLATVATLAILLQQPPVDSILPITSSHGLIAHAYSQMVHTLTAIDTNTLTLYLWVGGTFLGICITLACAGTEMRTQWLKAVMQRLPVH
jgi:hypothetical protein